MNRQRTLGILAVLGVVVAGGWTSGCVLERLTLMSGDNPRRNFTRLHEIFPSRRIRARSSAAPLRRAPAELPDHYLWRGEHEDSGAFLERTQTLGLVVLHEGALVTERYALGAGPESRLTSWSVAKSLLSALIGIALEEGHIRSIEDPVDAYAPSLAGSGYEGVSIRHVLQMSSGIAFDEDYDDLFSDINWMFMQGFLLGTGIRDYPSGLEAERRPGERFHYISVDSQVLTMVLVEATGMNASHYLETRLWQPAGMEGDAWWVTDTEETDAIEYGFCCVNATARDFARFGQLYLDRGFAGERAIVPADWVEESVVPGRPELELYDPASGWDIGYQYHWWVPRGDEGEFLAIGVWGQYVYVNRARRVVIAKNSADRDFATRDLESVAFFRAVARHLTEPAD